MFKCRHGVNSREHSLAVRTKSHYKYKYMVLGCAEPRHCRHRKPYPPARPSLDGTMSTWSRE